MYEICRLLAPKKVAKVRKVAAKAIRVGGSVELFMGPHRTGVVLNKRDAHTWNIQYADGSVAWFARSMMKAI